MVNDKLLLVLGCLLHSHSALAVFWSCSQNTDCASMTDSVCLRGECVCPPGKQAVLGGTACVDLAPYYWSPCLEDFQCSRLFTSFECRRSDNSTHGNCFCQQGSHYFRGRCWVSKTLGEQCSRDDECQGGIRDPFSMSCSGGTCQCSEGYYLRQRGECRKMALAVGDHCVLDEDCRFENGACGRFTLRCFDTTNQNETVTFEDTLTSYNIEEGNVTGDVNSTLSQHGESCDSSADCIEPLECSRYGVCVCPTGYYPNEGASLCLAELGSPVTSESQCVGIFTEIRNGVCTCQANFFFDDDMRSCVKAARLLTDFCMIDANCHTFGAYSRCGEPQQWGLRSCECLTEHTVWDANRVMCRLFSGIGEMCDVDSDCLAGELEINCQKDEHGQGFCACPPGYVALDGLCLTLGLELGDTCQVSAECTGTSNSVCTDGKCSCDSGYQQVNDFCAPSIGGTCASDVDCVVENTVCASTGTCQCNAGFVDYQAACWEVSSGFGAPCNVTAQCEGVMSGSACVDNICECDATYHFRDNGCWPRTGLFEACSRSSQCFLEVNSERVHCRNSLCQCTFDYPYSEESRTCRSSASSIFGNTFLIASILIFLFSS